MTDDQQLQSAVSLGQEAEAFVKSNLGRALVSRAQGEVARAVEGLKEVDPTDSRRITELQNEIWRAESFIVWLAEVVQEGMNAEEELDSEHSDD